jgi:VCBS repeat-containing protein
MAASRGCITLQSTAAYDYAQSNAQRKALELVTCERCVDVMTGHVWADHTAFMGNNFAAV